MLTFLIITFLRDEYLYACVKSIRETYGDVEIVVGDNNKDIKRKKWLEEMGCTYVNLPYDSGVAKGRNLVLKHIKTPYTCVGDDDFYYDEQAKVFKLLEYAKDKDADLVGGRIYEGGKVRNYQGNIVIRNDHFKFKPLQSERPTKCDITFNYFVARTSVLREVGWDSNIKVRYEHSDFFIALKKAKKKVYFHPEPVVIHKHPDIKFNPKRYQPFRRRASDKPYYFKKHNINYVIDFKGRKDRI